MPELVGAAGGLGVAHLTGAAVRRLGVTYGPYLGVRCRHANHLGCDLVGIDIVLRHAATSVVAVVGARRIVLRTPGEHDRVRYRDWVGTFSHAGFDRPDSPFYIDSNRNGPGDRALDTWAGYRPVYVPVELRIRFADGRRARTLFPHIFLSPGWG